MACVDEQEHRRFPGRPKYASVNAIEFRRARASPPTRIAVTRQVHEVARADEPRCTR